MLFDLTRLLLGLLYFYFGLNGFFHFKPLPPMNPQMTRFNEALEKTKIILPVVKSFEVIFGLALLFNTWTLLASLALAPVSFFIALAHLRFNLPKGLFMAILVAGCNLFLLYDQWVALSFLLQP